MQTLIIYADYFGLGDANEVFVYEGCLPIDSVIGFLSTMCNVHSWRLV